MTCRLSYSCRTAHFTKAPSMLKRVAVRGAIRCEGLTAIYLTSSYEYCVQCRSAIMEQYKAPWVGGLRSAPGGWDVPISASGALCHCYTALLNSSSCCVCFGLHDKLLHLSLQEIDFCVPLLHKRPKIY